MKNRISLFLILAFATLFTTLHAQPGVVVRPNDTTSMHTMVEPTNTFFGAFYGGLAGIKNMGCCNAFFGYEAGRSNTTGSSNTFVGIGAGDFNQIGDENTYVGRFAGRLSLGTKNTFLGAYAGYNNMAGSNNVFIGNLAGNTETGSNKLYIENSVADSASALIYGEFDNKYLRTSGRWDVNSASLEESAIRGIKTYAPGSNEQTPAIYGENAIDDNYGIGVHGRGGAVGVYGQVDQLGEASYWGVYGRARGNNEGTNIGVNGHAEFSKSAIGIAGGAAGDSLNYGVYGQASGGQLGYGVYGIASGASVSNFAGFFEGDEHVSGKVGIGTTVLSHKVTISSPDSNSLRLLGPGDFQSKARITFGDVNRVYLEEDVDDALTIDGHSRTAIMGTAVTIGTKDIATGYRLSVLGKVACEEVLVDLKADWPDYVFDKGYDLPSLKTHISENGHLPGVPSAEEIEEKGFEVGEMNRLLMEKVEELTLYILEQEKRISSLENKLSDHK